MTTDREAACWLMAALLVVVLTFSAAGCGLGGPTSAQSPVQSPAVFAAAAPAVRWTVRDEAQVLPDLVAAAGRAQAADRAQAAALGFDVSGLDAAAPVVPLFTLEQAAQLDSLVQPAVSDPVTAPQDTPGSDEPSDDHAAGYGAAGPVAAGGALTQAATRGLRAAEATLRGASPGAVALGLGGAAVLAFALQALVMSRLLRALGPAPTLRLGPAPTPFPRPPAGGAARPLPFPVELALGGARLARAA